MFGETHGTKEVPAVLENLLPTLAKLGYGALALEVPRDEQAALTLWAKDDTAPAPRFFAKPSPDGRGNQQVLALGQSYPQLNSSANFLNLQDNLADTENKLAFARQYYNDAVATLNRTVSTIPWMFVAPLAGVSEREYYQIPK